MSRRQGSLASDTKKDSKSRGGRPRGFDRDAAVAVAMRLFWRYGYEGVSISDLTGAIGIAAPSLYAAFGSKAGLFREALDVYASGPTALDLSEFDRAGDWREAVRGLLDAGVRAVTDPERERGCMISSGLLACGAEHQVLVQDLTDRRDAFRDALALRLTRWLDADEAASLARYVSAVMQGVSVQARDGATRRELAAVVDRAMGALARD